MGCWNNHTIPEETRIDVDATTSVSGLALGNAARIAGWIQERTGGDLFSIVVTEPYSSDYDECLSCAADEKAANSLCEMLPLELTFEDYNGIEKISYLPESLTTDGEPDSF